MCGQNTFYFQFKKKMKSKSRNTMQNKPCYITMQANLKPDANS